MLFKRFQTRYVLPGCFFCTITTVQLIEQKIDPDTFIYCISNIKCVYFTIKYQIPNRSNLTDFAAQQPSINTVISFILFWICVLSTTISTLGRIHTTVLLPKRKQLSPGVSNSLLFLSLGSTLLDFYTTCAPASSD